MIRNIEEFKKAYYSRMSISHAKELERQYPNYVKQLEREGLNMTKYYYVPKDEVIIDEYTFMKCTDKERQEIEYIGEFKDIDEAEQYHEEHCL